MRTSDGTALDPLAMAQRLAQPGGVALPMRPAVLTDRRCSPERSTLTELRAACPLATTRSGDLPRSCRARALGHYVPPDRGDPGVADLA